jgi:hypothetical protein
MSRTLIFNLLPTRRYMLPWISSPGQVLIQTTSLKLVTISPVIDHLVDASSWWEGSDGVVNTVAGVGDPV